MGKDQDKGSANSRGTGWGTIAALMVWWRSRTLPKFSELKPSEKIISMILIFVLTVGLWVVLMNRWDTSRPGCDTNSVAVRNLGECDE